MKILVLVITLALLTSTLSIRLSRNSHKQDEIEKFDSD
jgi:hypothetical protein